jgi:dUTP pyrophosphatase
VTSFSDCIFGNLLVNIDPNCPNDNPISPPVKEGDVGYDLRVWIKKREDSDLSSFSSINEILICEPIPSIIVAPQQMVNLGTGVSIKLPFGCWGAIKPRSSTFAKKKLFVMGGTIDEGYTGELSVFIWNPTNEMRQIVNGDRLAQLVISPRIVPRIKLVTQLPDTDRGSTGFGSTDY